MLAASQLALEIDRKPILQPMDWQLLEGRWAALIGPNGAGKSSLLKAVAQLLPLSGGSICLGSSNLAGQRPAALAASIGWLEQRPQVAFDYRVAEVVALGPQRGNLSVIQEAMHAFAVEDLALRRIASLSGGQQQRVQLARVFAQLNSSSAAQQCLLLDEALTGLDIKWQQQTLHIVSHWLTARPGRCVLTAMHDIGLAASWAHEVWLLQAGRLVFNGEPDQLTDTLLTQVWDYPLQIKQEGKQFAVCPAELVKSGQ